MKHLARGVLLLLLAWPAARAQDKPKDESPTPKAQYDALMKEYQTAQQDFFTALRGAKTPQEQMKRMQEESPKIDKVLARFIELAEKHPKDPVAVDALTMVFTGAIIRNAGKGPQEKALDLLLRDHVASDKLATVIPRLTTGDKRGEAALRAILEKNPHKPVQAEAALALAQALQRKAEIARRRSAADAAKAEAEAAAALKDVAEKHLASFRPERLVNLCMQLRFSSDKGSEALLRALLDKHEKREVQGNACLTLAQVLKGRADEAADKDPKEAEKLRKEAEDLLTRAAEKYGDVKMGFRGTVGEKAKGELYELRHLAIGQAAPDVEGEDQDGKKFKLSDYKGKVVLLDFWSQF